MRGRSGDPEIVGGRYRVDAALPTRGLGQAHRCFDLRDQRPLDLLRFPSGSAPAARLESRLDRLHGLHGPGLARVVDAFGAADGALDVLTEPSFGRSLGERLREAPLSVAEAVRILDAILAALDACHALDIPHRDLRPERIRLVDPPDGGPPWVVLHGAGLAWLLSEDAAPTLGGLAYGHPQFTAPEQWVNRRADARTDLYAVGLLGYLMLQGRNLVTSGSPVEACRQHSAAARRLIGISAAGEPVPGALAEAIRVGCHPVPEARHPDASAMRGALKRARGLIPPAAVDLTRHEVDEGSLVDLSLNLSVAMLNEMASSLELPELDKTVWDDSADPDAPLVD